MSANYQIQQGVRLYPIEVKALKHALDDFEGEVYIFGSRADLNAKGGDIDILLKPKKRNIDPWQLKVNISRRFMDVCEMKIDVLIWDEDNMFAKEVIKDAKKVVVAEI